MFFWFLFSRIPIEYGDLQRKPPSSVRIREITDQKNSEYGHFLCSAEDTSLPYLLWWVVAFLLVSDVVQCQRKIKLLN